MVPRTRQVRIDAAAERHPQVLSVSIPTPPNFALVGLAEDEGADGPVRTAIISGAGELFLVKEGEAITRQYRVATISSDHVEVTDVAGTALHLALK